MASENTKKEKIPQRVDPYFFVALIMPDIPQNAGNIGRLCVVTNCRLVLIRPLGFRLTDQQIQRSGMDYWDRVRPVIFDTLEEFLEWGSARRLFFLSSKGGQSLFQNQFQDGDVLCFGSESSGFPPGLLEKARKERTAVCLPMLDGERCLNVSASAAAVVYEGLRQILKW